MGQQIVDAFSRILDDEILGAEEPLQFYIQPKGFPSALIAQQMEKEPGETGRHECVDVAKGRRSQLKIITSDTSRELEGAGQKLSERNTRTAPPIQGGSIVTDVKHFQLL